MNRGFTLIEVMLTVLVMAIVLGIGLPVYLSFQTRSNLENALNATVEALRKAQMLARGGSHDSSWGVKMATGTVTVFEGASFALRDATLDEVTDIPDITPSGLNEVVFSKLTGEPLSSGTITLTIQNNETKSITINVQGALSY